MVAISLTWNNSSHGMAVKPIKSLVLHYTMIQFSIMADTSWPLSQSKFWNCVIQWPFTTTPSSHYLIIILDKLAISLIIFPFFHPLVLLQLLVLNPSVEFVIQQVLVLLLFQAHQLTHRVNPRNSPNVLLLSHVQILVMKKVVCFHKPG